MILGHEGCVCCTMKDSFVNSVLTIYSGLSPEYLIIEPTGVGKLSNIINNLAPILHGDVSLLNPIVVIAPRSFSRNMNEWGELLVILEDCLHGDLGHIARAKGTIPVGGEMLRFDLADGLYSISGSPDTANQCVFIGQNLEKEKLCKRQGALFGEKKVSLTREYLKGHPRSYLPQPPRLKKGLLNHQQSLCF